MDALDSPTRLRPSDRAGMYLTICVAAAAIIAIVTGTVLRLVEVLPGRDVAVLVPFVGESAELPIGPGGAPFPVQVSEAVVTVADPAAATRFALIAQPVVTGLAMIAVIVLFALLAWNLARGRAFTRANSRLIWWAAAALTGGWVIGTGTQTMGVNGALAAVSGHGYDGVTFATDWGPFFAVFGLAVIGAAFQIGERLQRETAGLV